jgi:glycolate oxidase iron-sulfur subunit
MNRWLAEPNPATPPAPLATPAVGQAPAAPMAAGGPAAHSPPSAEVVGLPGRSISEELLLDCVHCGLCTASCPTYVETGNENDSPRGRIYLMRAVREGKLPLDERVQRHLDLCLDCRACETACPSGVQYGKLIEPMRVDLAQWAARGTRPAFDWFHRTILLGLFPYPQRLQRALVPARWAQWLRLDRLLLASGLWRLLPRRLGRLVTLLPPLPRPLPPLPEFLPAKGRRRARVALFTGCVGDVLFRPTHWATARVLVENGCDVVVPPQQACCGAIHFHAGASHEARALADANLTAFDVAGVDAVIVNVAGCGSMLKDYGHHWHDAQQPARQRLAEKVRDVHEFLDQLGLIPPPGELRVKATYHDACHLVHAQKVRQAPRNLLRQVRGLTLVELPESELCCGAAGTYNLTQPEMADRLAHRKLANIRSTGAQLVITANAGCLLQIARQARLEGEVLPLMHPMDVLDRAYRQQSLRDAA